jgi:biopolymer transport protein ExbD
MVLIVFYLMVGKMASDQRADLPLPRSHAGRQEPLDDALVIEVRRSADGARAALSLAGTVVSPEALESTLRSEIEARPDRPIRVRADRTLAWALVDPARTPRRRHHRAVGGRTHRPGAPAVTAPGPSRAVGPLRRRGAAHRRDDSLGPSMTPMVDVVLVILIFFMASTTFLGPEWLLRSALPRDRPTQGSDPAFTLPPARFVIALSTDAAGATVADGIGLSSAPLPRVVDRLGEYARRLGPNQMTVVVSPGPLVPYRDVVRVHEACAALGIDRVGLD